LDTLALTDLLELSDLLLTSGHVRLRIASLSMVPTLRPGDEIAVQPASSEDIRVGDLILYAHRGQLICHRLVEVSGQPARWLTRGDAAGSAGERISPDRVLGKVVGIRKRTLWGGLKETLQSAFVPALLRWLPRLHQLRASRVLMRPLVVPFLSYHLGLAEGSRWYRWQALRREHDVPALPPSARPHLLLAKRGTRVVGWVFLVRRNAGWQCEDVYVRIRYRGLRLETDLARTAHRLVTAQRAHAQ
jgi:signal peptidase I